MKLPEFEALVGDVTTTDFTQAFSEITQKLLELTGLSEQEYWQNLAAKEHALLIAVRYYLGRFPSRSRIYFPVSVATQA